MTGLLYIDTLDAFTTYGVVPLSYLGPATWPALKTPDVAEWPEEDGIRPDLTAPQLSSREFDLQMAGISDSANIDALIAALTATGYHAFNFAEIGLTLNLRMVGQPQYTHFGTARVFSIRVADDTPLNGFTYTQPEQADTPEQEYALDGVNFDFYNARILNGTRDTLERTPDAKPGLLIDEPNIAGAIWDSAQTVYFKSKPIAIKCLIVSPTPAAFWINYNNLLSDMSAPSERIIQQPVQNTFYCYYQNNQVDRFEKTAIGGIWCEFTINMIATRASLPQ